MKYLKCNTIQYNEIKLIKHTARIPCSLRIQPPPMFDLFRRNFPPSLSDADGGCILRLGFLLFLPKYCEK